MNVTAMTAWHEATVDPNERLRITKDKSGGWCLYVGDSLKISGLTFGMLAELGLSIQSQICDIAQEKP